MNDATNSLPKQELLIKLLGMTTSSNDGEALAACRKANQLLTGAGWSWDRLIHGKITVVADPFSNIQAPPTAKQPDPDDDSWARPTTVTTPNRPPPAAPPRPQRPPPPPPPPPMPNAPKSSFQAAGAQTGRNPAAAQAPKNYSIKPNRYEGYCFCCGQLVGQQGGFIFEPSKQNPKAVSKWQIICTGCNQGAFVPSSPAPRRTINPNASVGSL